MFRFRPSWFLTLPCTMLLLCGCGKAEAPKADITGTVTFAGKPLVFGTIDFVPDESKSHHGPGGSAEIRNGAFDTTATQSGVFAGPHMIRVSGYEAIPTVSGSGAPDSPPPPLFLEYPTTADIQSGVPLVIEVPESARGLGLPKPGTPQPPAAPPP